MLEMILKTGTPPPPPPPYSGQVSESKLSSSGTFGISISLNGSGDFCVAGAHNYKKVLSFTRDAKGVWTGPIEIVAGSEQSFGVSVSLNQNGDILAVGTNLNVAYVYKKKK